MLCYYEVLSVPFTAGPDELKKAYYKLSLTWHPDKNPGDTERATEVFKEIQEAYRVLSDPQERAWYDSHRAQILQAGSRSFNMDKKDYVEERIDVFAYFVRSCFSDYSDTAKGFYTVYGELFEAVAAEERRAAAVSGHHPMSDSCSDDEDGEKAQVSHRRGRSYPSFGKADSSYTRVVLPFYAFWEAFKTKKSYSWMDEYDTRQADSRMCRRAMENDNQRRREAARRERNEEIRQLVAFVKKRDKRVEAERERIKVATLQSQARSHEASINARQRESARLKAAWEEEVLHGSLASQWASCVQAELARLEAELDGRPVEAAADKKETQKPGGGDRSFLNDDVAKRETRGGSEPPIEEEEELYCVACDKLFASLKSKANHEASKKHRKQVELLRSVLLQQEKEQGEQEDDEKEEEEEEEAGRGGGRGTAAATLMAALNSSVRLLRVGEECSPEMGAAETTKLTRRGKKAQRKRLNALAKEQMLVSASEATDETSSPAADHIVGVSDLPQHSTQTDEPTFVIPSSFACENCAEEFNSKNKLFIHLKETGHASLRIVQSIGSCRNGKRIGKITKK